MQQIAQDPVTFLKLVADILAGTVTVAALMQWLPPIAAGLSIIWLLIQIGSWLYKLVKKSKNDRV